MDPLYVQQLTKAYFPMVSIEKRIRSLETTIEWEKMTEETSGY
jgi:hypothetical protein